MLRLLFYTRFLLVVVLFISFCNWFLKALVFIVRRLLVLYSYHILNNFIKFQAINFSYKIYILSFFGYSV